MVEKSIVSFSLSVFHHIGIYYLGYKKIVTPHKYLVDK